ncbi:MAG: hypothetical protein LBQ59_04000 [Candidatus Peribacteria bacterium]|jgi:hypothetical protein|nr:hypothetical protein [Candidatus Peribacteria bacterium]
MEPLFDVKLTTAIYEQILDKYEEKKGEKVREEDREKIKDMVLKLVK